MSKLSKIINQLEKNRAIRVFPNTSPNSWMKNNRVKYQFFYLPDKSRLIGLIHFKKKTEGPPSFVHGGCSASILDSIAGSLVIRQLKCQVLTANLNINYLNAIPVNSTVVTEAIITEIKEKKVSVIFRSMSRRVWSKMPCDDGLPIFSYNSFSPKSEHMKSLYQYGTALFIKRNCCEPN